MNAFIDVSEDHQLLELVRYAAALNKDQPDFEQKCVAMLEQGNGKSMLEELIQVSHLYYAGDKGACSCRCVPAPRCFPIK